MKYIDKVYVCTTQLGFEALMCGKEVHTFGMPFYAGWGLTTDKLKCERRTAKRTLEELFYITYIKNTHYIDPEKKCPCSIERAMEYLIELRDEYKNNPIPPVKEKGDKDISFIQKIFSVRNQAIRKVVTIFGIKFKFKSKKLQSRNNLKTYKKKKIVKDLIISLTSYPARIDTVNQAIKSLLNQTLAAEKIVLWLSDTQFPNLENDLPSNLLKLKEDGLEIEWYHQEHDIKPYNKLINTLKKYPDKIIITVDDDIIYEKDRIMKLYKEYLKNPQYIHCHRAHRILFKNRKILPYNKWKHEIKNVKPSYNNFLTGVGCVLYPPHCFYKDILREDLFVQLAPDADDIWFWAMAVLNGTKINVVKNNYRNLTYVNGTQETSLWKTNVTKNQNDPKIQKVLSYYPQILKRLDKHNYFYNNLAERIFSVKNENMKKIVTILGVRLKFKSKRLKQKQKLQDIEKRLANQQKIINEQQKIIDNLQNVTLKNNQIAALTEIAMLKTKYNWDDIKIPVIKSNSDTVLELINSDKSIIRFGDGDFNIMEGNNICFQNSQPLLAERLKQIIADGDKNLLIGIPYPYYECSINLTNVSQKFILNWFSKWHKIMAKYYNYDRIYYSTHISQMHPEYANYDFETHYNNFKRVWHNKKITIVTGDRVYNNIQYNIFENASEISYIFGPTENAFDKYNELREQLQNVTKDNILIFALGPAGKVLAYDMYKLGYRVLDLGHLIKDYDFYKKSKSMTSDEWNKSRSVFFKKD